MSFIDNFDSFLVDKISQKYLIKKLLRFANKWRWLGLTSSLRLYSLWYRFAKATMWFSKNRFRCSSVGVLKCHHDRMSVLKSCISRITSLGDELSIPGGIFIWVFIPILLYKILRSDLGFEKRWLNIVFSLSSVLIRLFLYFMPLLRNRIPRFLHEKL